MTQSKDDKTKAYWCSWKDHPGNPLLEPPWRWPNAILADPSVVIPEDSPDGKWHLFAHSLKGIHHYLSEDGIDWVKVEGPGPLFKGLRPYVYRDGDQYFLLYERILRLIPLKSVIEIRSSRDLYQWGPGTVILRPSLPWEGSSLTGSTTGNPFLMKRDGQYWLYYSAATVFLRDCLYVEPKYIGVARAETVLGPYHKQSSPILGPSPHEPYRNMGAGSIKLLPKPWECSWIGFNNGIYRDKKGRSRSAILVLASDDGLRWDTLCRDPIIGPMGQGWRKAFVYAFDVRQVGHGFRMYYNARDGWLFGTERIGLAVLTPPP